jgi:CheY-like chemotaxis protein
VPEDRRAVVLLVESDRDNRDMYAEYLEESGFAIVTAGTTDEGLARAEDADVIVTGVLVPGPYDGIELVRRLRGDRSRNRPVIVLTTCAFESVRQRAIAAGCSAFLEKPCLPDTLAATLREIAGQIPVRPAGRRSIAILTSERQRQGR